MQVQISLLCFLFLWTPIMITSAENEKFIFCIEYDEQTICFLEEQIPELAEAAVKEAYLDALASGSSVLISKEGWLVEVFPDGTERIIRELPLSTSVVPSQILKTQ